MCFRSVGQISRAPGLPGSLHELAETEGLGGDLAVAVLDVEVMQESSIPHAALVNRNPARALAFLGLP
jgi:hypothetical protein